MRPQHDDSSMRGRRTGVPSDEAEGHIQTARLMLTRAGDSDVEYELRRAAFLALDHQASADLNRSSWPRAASLGDARASTLDCPGPTPGTPPR